MTNAILAKLSYVFFLCLINFFILSLDPSVIYLLLPVVFLFLYRLFLFHFFSLCCVCTIIIILRGRDTFHKIPSRWPGIYEDFTWFGSRAWSYHARFLHHVDDARG